MRIQLSTRPDFDFRRTVASHGWCSLAPFEVDRERGRLRTTVDCEGAARRLELSEAPGGVEVRSPGRVPAAERPALFDAARQVLNLQLDLEPFYRKTDAVAGFDWVRTGGYGRLLRGATPFEDVVKLVLTTNCTWTLTCRMTSALVERYGAPSATGERAFPRPEVLARVTERSYRERVKVGYRAPHLRELGRRFARGEVDPAGWPERAREDPTGLRKELLGSPGVGPYVADNVLRLSGAGRGLGLDSWLRAEQARVYHGGRRVKDRTIERRYRRFGDWAGLAIWCDMTRDRPEEGDRVPEDKR